MSRSLSNHARRAVCLRAALFSLFVAVGCSESGPGDDDSDGDALVATADASEVIGTVVTIRWTTEEPSTGYVEYGADGGHETQVWSAATDATSHEVVLFGLKTSTEYAYRVVAVIDDVESDTFESEFTTGVLPGDLSQHGLTVEATGDHAGGYLLAPIVSTPPKPVIMDRDGDIVWWFLDQDFDHDMHISVGLSCDGQHVLFNSMSTAYADQADPHYIEHVVRLSLDGTELERIEKAEHSHTFVELPDGTIAFLVYDRRDVDGENVVGDQIVEVAPDGTETVVWSAFDDFDYDPEDPPPGTGWSHAAALDYDPVEEAYFVSLRNFACIVKIGRSSGDMAWQLGGRGSSFEIEGEVFTDQHEFQILDGGAGIVLFDNGTAARYNSRVLEYALDTDSWTATQQWSYQLDPPIFVPTGGDVMRLPSGNTLVTWSSAGQIDEVTPDGALVWRQNMDLGGGFGFTQWQQDLYAPVLPNCALE